MMRHTNSTSLLMIAVFGLCSVSGGIIHCSAQDELTGKLEGRWTIYKPLTKRLTGHSKGHEAIELHAEKEAAALMQKHIAKAAEGQPIVLAGVALIGDQKSPFAIVPQQGRLRLFYLSGNEKLISQTLVLVTAANGSNDLLLLGDATSRQAFAAYERETRSRSLTDLKHVHFEKLVGTHFTIHGEENGVQYSAHLTLTEVKDHKHPSDKNRPSEVRDSGFSLIFSGEDIHLEDRIHEVDHEELGSFQLFLHRTVRDKQPDHIHYVAVFN